VLRGDTRATRGRGWRRAQQTLVAAQIAVALSLLLGAGLTGSSFMKLRRVDIGFAPAGAAKFSIHLPFRDYPTFQRTAAFHLAVRDALRAIPGVSDAGVAMQFPSTPQLLGVQPSLETTGDDGRTARTLVTANVVSADFFRAMGIPLVAGRTFGPGDLGSATPAVVLGASLARALFGTGDPIGREVRIASRGRHPSYRVVGVSGDVYGDRLIDGALQVLYFPLLDDLPPTSTETEDRIPFMPAGVHFVVRSDLPLAALLPAFRSAVASVDPRVPLWDVRTLDAVVGDSTSRTRLMSLLLGLAAATTLVLGVIGLYSVVAYAVAGRAREFAVRLAIGATPGMVTRQVLKEGAAVACVGIAAGIGLSLANASVLRGVLFEVSATDPLMYVVAAAVVLSCTALATYAPARRAGDADPVLALHSE
jgi:predicted permease